MSKKNPKETPPSSPKSPTTIKRTYIEKGSNNLPIFKNPPPPPPKKN